MRAGEITWERTSWRNRNCWFIPPRRRRPSHHSGQRRMALCRLRDADAEAKCEIHTRHRRRRGLHRHSLRQSARHRGRLRFRNNWRARKRVRGTAVVGLSAPAQRCDHRGCRRIASWLCARPRRAGKFKARVIKPDEVGTLTRGSGSNARHIRNVLPEDAEAESVLVVEVITPGGHWSSYPPHKHDRDALPDESYLEETYYHRLKPAQGFAFQRIYTEDRSLDETLTVERWRRRAGATRLSSRRRAARLRSLLSQRHGRTEARLALSQRSGARVADGAAFRLTPRWWSVE